MFGFAVSKSLSSVVRNEPRPPSSKTQKSSVTGSPAVPPPEASGLSSLHATATNETAKADASTRRHFIESPPLRRAGELSRPLPTCSYP